MFIKLESEEKIDVFFNISLGYNVEEDVESESDNGFSCSLRFCIFWRFDCNLEVFIAVDGLWGYRVIKGITDSGSGIWYKKFGVFGISGRRGLGISIKPVSDFLSRNVWLCNVFEFTFCVLVLIGSEVICW